MTADRMTEEEARKRLEAMVSRNFQRHDPSLGNVDACAESCLVESILATHAALAVLLDPEAMLRAWEEAGRVFPIIEWTTPTGLHVVHTDWRIVEGA